MSLRKSLLLIACLLPAFAWADDQAPNDVFGYSVLEADHLRMHSDFFNDDSSGNGFKASYDFADGVYLFGRWAKLDFDNTPGGHTLQEAAVGAHQAYSSSTSFYVDLGFLRDVLDKNASFNGATDAYWRVTYGFRSQLSDLFELDGAIFTERNTDFGRRPFGERLGFGIDFVKLNVLAAVEHTADGNRAEISLIWNYR